MDLKEFSVRFCNLSKLVDQIESRLNYIEKRSDERYEALFRKAENTIKIYTELKCTSNEKEISELKFKLHALEVMAEKGEDQNIECRKNTTELGKMQLLISQNEKQDNRQESRFSEIVKYIGALIICGLTAWVMYLHK